jgi:3',5'-cyclic AMP phosphodiesterase CpdA
VYGFPAEQTLIVGLNSCIRGSELDEDHYGWIGLDQVRAAAARCDEIDPEGRWLRIAALHHNFLCGSNLDNENLRDADQIRPVLEKAGIHLILHGHCHIAHIEQRKSVTAPAPLNILATGSAGLDAETLPDHPNQYQVIEIDDGDRGPAPTLSSTTRTAPN